VRNWGVRADSVYLDRLIMCSLFTLFFGLGLLLREF
jgi:hypothetical protein